MPLQLKETETKASEAAEKEVNLEHLSHAVDTGQWMRLLIVLSSCLLIVAVIGVVLGLLSRIGHTLLIFSLGGLLAYALSPLVLKLQKPGSEREMKRSKAVFIVFGVLLLFVAAGVSVMSAEVARQATHLVKDHAALEANGKAQLVNLDEWLASKNINFSLQDKLDDPPENFKSWGQAAAQHVVKTLTEISKSVVEGLIVALIALYFLLYGTEMKEGVNRMLPERMTPYAEAWESDVNHILGGFVRGQFTLALLIGAMAAVACFLCGVKFWLLIGLFVTVCALIPVFGPVIGTVPAVISAALSPPGPFPNVIVKIVIVLVLFVILNEVGSKILYPRLVGGALGLHEVFVLFALFAGLEVGGLIGVLYAAPLCALVIATCKQAHRLWRGEEPLSIKGNAEPVPSP